jgi:hypothetical protein
MKLKYRKKLIKQRGEKVYIYLFSINDEICVHWTQIVGLFNIDSCEFYQQLIDFAKNKDNQELVKKYIRSYSVCKDNQQLFSLLIDLLNSNEYEMHNKYLNDDKSSFFIVYSNLLELCRLILKSSIVDFCENLTFKL